MLATAVAGPPCHTPHMVGTLNQFPRRWRCRAPSDYKAIDVEVVLLERVCVEVCWAVDGVSGYQVIRGLPSLTVPGHPGHVQRLARTFRLHLL